MLQKVENCHNTLNNIFIMNIIGRYERYGNIIINKNQPLGSGQYGFVWKGYTINPNKDLETVAIKQSFQQQFKQNMNEIETLQILNHPNIIKYIDYKISGNSILMVMQLCQGGTLDNLLYSMQNHEPSKLINYYSQIVAGIRFMYNKKILHRDLKPQNILIKKNTVKIADFGQSKMNSSHTMKTMVGTPLFSSPQLLQFNEGEKDAYTEKSEIWALGLILYYMFNYSKTSVKSQERLRQSVPWTGKNSLQLIKNILNQPLIFKKPQNIPEQIKQIIKKMLVVDASKRMSFEEFFNLEIFQPQETLLLTSLKFEEEDESEQKTIQQANRETIDWQLQQLIQMKVHENTAVEENEQCRQFFELLIEEFSEVYEIKYYELMYELEHHYFKITNRPEQRTKILQKYFERKEQFHSFSPMETELENEEQFIKNQSGILLAHKDSIENVMPLPGQTLITECKKFLKDKLFQILQISSPKKIKAPKEQFRFMLFTLYDFFTLLNFSKSWEIKRKFKISVADYKKSRRAVSYDKIIGRIRMAADSVSL